jgi:hypothetical protein
MIEHFCSLNCESASCSPVKEVGLVPNRIYFLQEIEFTGPTDLTALVLSPRGTTRIFPFNDFHRLKASMIPSVSYMKDLMALYYFIPFLSI